MTKIAHVFRRYRFLLRYLLGLCIAVLLGLGAGLTHGVSSVNDWGYAEKPAVLAGTMGN